MITTTVLPYLVSPLKLTNNIDGVGGGCTCKGMVLHPSEDVAFDMFIEFVQSLKWARNSIDLEQLSTTHHGT